MRWLAKKFFWSMVFSAASLLIMQLSPQGKKYQALALQMLVKKAKPAQGTHEFRHGEEKSIANQVIKTVEKVATIEQEEPQTVTINGVVYPKSADNIYEINGERMFYIDKKAQRQTASTEVEAELTAATELQQVPVTPGQMLEVMQKAGQNMKERNQALDEMLKE